MRPIDADSLKGCAIVRPHNREEIAMIRKFSDLVNHFDIPTIEPEVRHGRWEYDDVNDLNCCSECGTGMNGEFLFCPWCGAKMDGN